ncbi:MAG: hypothetical protein Q7K28_01435 [Candidatus Wildermuthbacteria bacterium]|nr:hypothetical protein [Candidatus Wildermuthbacteria bacterium]
MILTTHLLIGAAIAQKFQNPVLGLFLAFLSHYFLDSLVHRDYGIDRIKEASWKNSFFDLSKVFLDGSFGIFLILLLSDNIFLALAGGFFAILPDGLGFLHLTFPKIRILSLHSLLIQKTHWFKKYGFYKKIPLLWGISTQILIAILAIYYLR